MKKNVFSLLFCLVCAGASAQGYHFEPVGGNGNATTTSSQNERSATAQTAYNDNARTGLRRFPMEFGGSLGFGFGSHDAASLQIAPTVGWRFNQYIAAGIGLNYIYYKNNYDVYGLGRVKTKQNYLGGGVYVRGTLFNYLALYARPELNYMWGNYKLGGQKISLDSKAVPSVILGVGGYIPAGTGAIMAMVYYDVVQDDWSPYGSNIGYSFGYIFNF